MTYDDLMTAVLHGRDAEKEQQALERITAFVNEMHTRSYETGLPMSVELLSAFQGFVSNYTDAPESTYDQWALAFTYWQKAAEETVSSKERFEQGLAEAKARALKVGMSVPDGEFNPRNPQMCRGEAWRMAAVRAMMDGMTLYLFARRAERVRSAPPQINNVLSFSGRLWAVTPPNTPEDDEPKAG